MWEGEVILFTKQAGNSPMPKEKSIIWKLPGSYFFQIRSLFAAAAAIGYSTEHYTKLSTKSTKYNLLNCILGFRVCKGLRNFPQTLDSKFEGFYRTREQTAV